MDPRNPQAPYRCDSCGEKVIRKNAEDAQNLWRRLEPGQMYTDKECHECGALMWPVPLGSTAKPSSIDEALTSMVAGLVDNGVEHTLDGTGEIGIETKSGQFFIIKAEEA